MAIRVSLHHRTIYDYDRLVELSPQIVRLRPAPHCRTPILSYSLEVQPEDHFIRTLTRIFSRVWFFRSKRGVFRLK